MRSTDELRDCLLYTDYSQPVLTYAWVRDNQVVTVGVARQFDEGVRVATEFGPTVGEEFDVASGLNGGQVDTGAPVLVARLIEGDSIATLADADADGVLDIASVGTPAGDECQSDESSYQDWVSDDTSPYEAGALLGLGLGISVEQAEALPDWNRGESLGACVMYWGAGGGAYVLDGVVVGLEPTWVVDGPSVGQTMNEAAAGIGMDRI